MNSLDKRKALLQHDIQILYENVIEYMQITQAIDKRRIRAINKRKTALLKLLETSE